MNKEELLESLKKSGFSPEIISAFVNVKREDFIPERLRGFAYEDIALPIQEGASISQPYTIAFILDLLQPRKGNKILEIGSGSGYFLALMSEMIKEGKIYGIEIQQRLAIKSKRILTNPIIQIIIKNGYEGLPEVAPFDRIIISASSQELPRHLYSQLTEQGIMVCAVKNSIFQIKKENGKVTEREFSGFSFVPLIK